MPPAHAPPPPCADPQRPAVIATSNKHLTYQTSPVDRTSVRFDLVLPPGSSQAEVYSQLGEPCLQAVQDGLNVSILCYGQTGAGKTHTLIGQEDEQVGTPLASPGAELFFGGGGGGVHELSRIHISGPTRHAPF